MKMMSGALFTYFHSGIDRLGQQGTGRPQIKPLVANTPLLTVYDHGWVEGLDAVLLCKIDLGH